jgi:hypothetical protein
MKHLIISAILSSLAFASCASSPLPSTPAALAHAEAPDVQGRWVGTFFQDNAQRGYPMQLTAKGRPNGFVATLDWPEPWQSRTVGEGSSQAGSVVWTEERLIKGKNILLGGRYDAALIDQDTLVGVYEKDGSRMGFFRLSRAHGDAKLTEIPPISVKVKLSG